VGYSICPSLSGKPDFAILWQLTPSSLSASWKIRRKANLSSRQIHFLRGKHAHCKAERTRPTTPSRAVD